MKTIIPLFLLLTITLLAFGQNVGIGTNTPNHKLDVTGDINVTGNLRASGVAGSANQVLTATGAGTMAWTDMTRYSNNVSFSSGSGTWTVPADVTKIMVEVWGGGGGGSCAGGGGGGGYISGYFTVTPGSSVSYVVGGEGSGSNCEFTTSNHGSNSTATVGSVTLTGFAGLGSYRYSTSSYWLGRGGSYQASPVSFRNWRGMPGEDGTPNQTNYVQTAAGVFMKFITGGDGGNGGNTRYTNSHGGTIHLNGSTLAKYITTGDAKPPGGGGGGNSDHSVIYYGSPGAPGMVIISY